MYVKFNSIYWLISHVKSRNVGSFFISPDRPTHLFLPRDMGNTPLNSGTLIVDPMPMVTINRKVPMEFILVLLILTLKGKTRIPIDYYARQSGLQW